MQTLPCGHRVVCRKCFIKTIQSAIADHSLPLKCIVCRASVLKLGSCKPDKTSSTQQTPAMLLSSSSSSATPSKSSRRPASSLPTRTLQPRGTTSGAGAASKGSTVGPGNANGEHSLTRPSDVGRPPETSSSTTVRLRDSSSHRASHRGCCPHHQIPLRHLNGQQDAALSGARITKLQPLPIYPARGSAPTQRRAFSSTAAASLEPTSSAADARDCASSSGVRSAQTGHRPS